MYRLFSFAWFFPLLLLTLCPAPLAFGAETLESLETQLTRNPAAVLAAMDQPGTLANAGDVAFLRSKALLQMGQAKAAIEAARAALAADEGQSRYHTQYAKALLSRISSETMFAMTNTGRFLRALDKAIELDPEDGEPRLYKTMFYLNAPAIAGGSRAKAEAEQRDMAAVSEIHGLLAQLAFLRADDKQAEAEPVHRRLLALAPDSVGFIYGFGRYLRHAKRYDEAQTFLDAQLARFPEEPRILYALAAAQISGEKAVEAGITGMKQFIKVQAAHAEGPAAEHAWYWIGKGYELLNNNAEARAAYEQSLALNPKLNDVRERLNQLAE